MKKIIVPVDFSSASERATQYVESVFKGQPVGIELIYVVPPAANTSNQEVLENFRKFEERVLKSSPVIYGFHIYRGPLLDEIQRAIHDFRPDYVVMGTAKASLAKALVKLTDCPVIVIPDIGNKSEIKTIGYANDFKDIKVSPALKPLLDISSSFGAKVHIIHISSDPHLTSDRAEAAIEYYLDGTDHEYVFINSDNIPQAIHDYVLENNIDLLAVLIRDHGGNILDSKGSLVEELIANTEVPLLSLI